ncbi:MAG: ATP phosphoribosyltransferase regulatory subunit, partial [Clostridia bacterium]|nr:ATP phosphoribosyltransferase regulatory subunit [Clostridia bacterium]
QSQAIEFISQKNTHDLARLCENFEISTQKTDKLISFISTYGEREEVLKKLNCLCKSESIKELETLSAMLSKCEFSDKIIFDFSVVNDMSYYNGFVFKGFLSGICEGVLSGGQYDNLMQKMDRKSGAVGFALYLDLLEQLIKPKKEYDVDVLLIYKDSDDKQKLAQKVNELINQGLSVSAQKSVPEKLRYKQKVEL